MISKRNDIIDQLQKAILPLQGFKSLSSVAKPDIGFKPLEQAFPNAIFPAGVVHEFLSSAPEDAAATSGFVAALFGRLIQRSGTCLWISSSRMLFPPALEAFGIEPHKIIFIDVKKEMDALWVMEEALKCERLTAVVGEIKEVNLTASRRLQLAVEQSKVTGFILRHQPSSLNPIASVSRWKITSLSSHLEDGMPGVGFPRWNVELLKVRNGKPGSWQIEWSAGCFHSVNQSDYQIITMPSEDISKTG